MWLSCVLPGHRAAMLMKANNDIMSDNLFRDITLVKRTAANQCECNKNFQVYSV